MLEFSFINVSDVRSTTLLKRDSNTGVLHTYFMEHLRTVGSDGSESDDSENDDVSYNESIEVVFVDVLENRDS